jgi:hypothetical protein
MCTQSSPIPIAALFSLAIALPACGSDDRSGQSVHAGRDGTAGGGGREAGGTGAGNGATGTGGTGGSSGAGGVGGMAGGSGATEASRDAGVAGGIAAAGVGGASGSGGYAGVYPKDGAIYDGTLGPTGTVPIGSLCANDQNCSPEQGAAVCCVNTCRLAEDCPGGSYLRCVTQSDCEAFGGKVCCDVSGLRFCTKPSACEGQLIP